MALGVLMMVTLTGCYLAKEGAGTDMGEDKLIGMFITTEHLDRFDMAGYLNDNLKGVQGGNIIMDGNTEEYQGQLYMDGNTEEYQGRLYAELTTETLTSEETGETSTTEEYVFPLDGIAYFSANVPAKGDRDSYLTAISDPAISDGQIAHSLDEGSNHVTMTGTVYVSPTSSERSFFFNPVYQNAEGEVYLTAGTGMLAPLYGEGASMSQTMEATTTLTDGGKTSTDSISVTLSVSVLFAPTKIVILQMDEQSNLISRTEYSPDAMPESISLEETTAYLIVETHKRDHLEQVIISRELYGSDAENVETFMAGADGICVKKWSRIEWQE
jgi:hypothetical protein